MCGGEVMHVLFRARPLRTWPINIKKKIKLRADALAYLRAPNLPGHPE